MIKKFKYLLLIHFLLFVIKKLYEHAHDHFE
jgi:hypothetical protein